MRAPYVPKPITENVNVTRESPLKRFFILSAEILFAVVVAYVFLGLVAGLLAPRVPVSLEKKMGEVFDGGWEEGSLPTESARLQSLLNKLVPGLPAEDRRLSYRAWVVENEQVNALALPGGRIVVFSGLVNEVARDAELSFVLAHELGHFHARDHLRALGRGLVAMVFAVAVSGSDGGARFVMQGVGNAENRFSQAQERAADLFAVRLLRRRLGTTDGATEAMRRLAEDERAGKLAYYFATHPHPETRLKYISEEISRLKSS